MLGRGAELGRVGWGREAKCSGKLGSVVLRLFRTRRRETRFVPHRLSTPSPRSEAWKQGTRGKPEAGNSPPAKRRRCGNRKETILRKDFRKPGRPTAKR